MIANKVKTKGKDELAKSIANLFQMAISDGTITPDEALDLGRDLKMAIYAGTHIAGRYAKKEIITTGATRFPHLATAAKEASTNRTT